MATRTMTPQQMGGLRTPIIALSTPTTDVSLKAVLDDIGAEEELLLLPPIDGAGSNSTWTISTQDITIPRNVTLRVPQGTLVSVSGGRTLLIEGPVLADDPDWYSGDGTITFTYKRWGDEEAYAEAFTNFVISGGTHSTSANNVSPSFSLEARTSAGRHVFESSITVTYTAGAGTYWVVAHGDQTSTVAGWTRETGTHILWQQIGAQPALPANSVWLMQVTIDAVPAITVVADIRTPASYAVRGVYDVTDQLYGATGDGATDDTAALQAAYAAVKSVGVTTAKDLFIPSGIYLITSPLVWDGSVNVRGQSKEGTILRKNADVTGIQIGSLPGPAGSETTFENFTLDVDAAVTDTSNGINTVSAGRTTLRQILVRDVGGDGINHGGGHRLLMEQCMVTDAGNVGFRINSGVPKATNINTIVNCHFQSCTSHGVELTFSDGNFFWGCSMNNNGGYGINIDDSVASVVVAYFEANASGSVQFTANAIRNLVIAVHSAAGGIDDTTPANKNSVFGLSDALGGALSVPTVFRHAPSTNVAGTDFSVLGQTAGAGATGVAGGRMLVFGGDAAGTTGDANGGIIRVNGGNPVNSGRSGHIEMATNTSGVTVGSTGAPTLSTAFEIRSTTQALLLSRMTTGERDALTAINGMVIYNSTLNKFQGYENGAWTSLI